MDNTGKTARDMHEDHRQRLRERFLAEGLESFEPHQALELLLCYAIPRRDTNELAHALIDHFGSLAAVLDAHPDDLTTVPGVGRNAAVLLALMNPLWRLYRRQSLEDNTQVIDNYRTACSFAVSLFAGRVNEALYLLCMDPGCRVLRCQLLQEGTVNEVSVHPRTVVEAAIRSNATQVILMHNHPKGDLQPSANDLTYTRRLLFALQSIGVDVVDHIIVSEEEALSLAREGALEDIIRDIEGPLQQERRVYSNEQAVGLRTRVTEYLGQ